jgi:phosphoribosylaminoimidazole-succinocarboxamide synthase
VFFDLKIVLIDVAETPASRRIFDVAKKRNNPSDNP